MIRQPIVAGRFHFSSVACGSNSSVNKVQATSMVVGQVRRCLATVNQIQGEIIGGRRRKKCDESPIISTLNLIFPACSFVGQV
ncbi:MAG: hypothetical protein FJ147_24610 [Deltaproteobacteria bacterium]|nr:hypothetical protein [Deltaproteobacteria bacterium]